MERFVFGFGVGFFGLRFLLDVSQRNLLHAVYTASATALSIYGVMILLP